jgi:hypothetical protein
MLYTVGGYSNSCFNQLINRHRINKIISTLEHAFVEDVINVLTEALLWITFQITTWLRAQMWARCQVI